MMGFISKLFGGNKSEKDVKLIEPVVVKINQFYADYQSLTNDQLRAKTAGFKDRIKQHLAETDAEIARLKQEAEALPVAEMQSRDTAYQEIDKLVKERDKKIEEILKEILPEAFAVVKETAHRFKDNTEVIVTATELDKELSVKKDYIRIEGDKAIYKNSWTAAGGTVTWNMLHYDVQLIGGAVLHSGKIAEMATGEGKTLVSTLPAYLNAGFAGKLNQCAAFGQTAPGAHQCKTTIFGVIIAFCKFFLCLY